MNILGISSYYHDSAACLLQNGHILAAAQEERFSRIKHDSRFPINAVIYCMQEAKIGFEKIDKIVFYDNPALKWKRILDTYTSYAPIGRNQLWDAVQKWKSPLNPKKNLYYSIKSLCQKDKRSKIKEKITFVNHHLSHAASSFFPSPFEEAAILTLDGVGEYATTTYGQGKGNSVNLEGQIFFPDSIGLLYSAFTYYLGFKVNSGEYKVMGLAPYGEPIYADAIKEEIISWKENGSYKLNLENFDFFVGEKIIAPSFGNIFKMPAREPETPITQKHCDIAASIQAVTEEALLRLATYVRETTNQTKLCLAGGVALNCVANGKLLRKKIFDKIWIQPAAGDAGGALGAAFAYYYMNKENKRCICSDEKNDLMEGCCLGPSFSNDEIESYLKQHGYPYQKLSDEKLFLTLCDLLNEKKVIGWFSGRMEFGPRALGNRSIIADPRSTKMQSLLNLKIKFRESFRPFAPSVLEEFADKYFDLNGQSPYMLLVADVREDHRIPIQKEDRNLNGIEKIKIPISTIPAVTHVDYSARIHTVNEKANPRFYKLIKAFHDKTNCPILVNTSFNVRGEPIVCKLEDAYRCFMNTGMDALSLENCLLLKEKQPVFFNENNNSLLGLD